MTIQTLYEKDFHLWIEQTINYLQNGDLTNLDRENLIEEIKSMGNSEKRETFSRLKILVLHLLKWKYQSQKQTSSWLNTIDEQREQLELILKDSPSLKPYLQTILSDCYQKAVRATVNETNISHKTFPCECPFTTEQILDPDYFPN
ncbi:DUF29 domain-containing protein [Cylindrospermopsis raciborskii]|uniref:DUF29 domain-containing protein n=1 Tax=Cylindrospermopsis raciborskii TaxID=77022 RepID=UPI0038D2570D